LRPFKDIFRKLENFDCKCEAFIKITRLFEDIFKEIESSEDFSKITRLFEDIFNKIEYFLK
jgi:hypothetical protein